MMSGDGSAAEPYPARSLFRAFEAQVRRAPSAPAVRCGEEQLSYAELHARADLLARYLRERGLRRGELVAVSMGRTPDLLVAMLAVLKAGAAYVPVEPSAPEQHIRHVLTAAQPAMILTVTSHQARLADIVPQPLICLDTEAMRIGGLCGEPPGPEAGYAEAGPNDLACVFFTSGSTGRPKGAMNAHGNLLSSFEGLRAVFGFDPADRHLQSTTFEFDVFTADWIRALCSGGVLVMARRNFTLDWTADIAELHELILAERITVMETNVLTIRRLFAYIRAHGLKLGELRLLTVGADKWYLDEQTQVQEYLGEAVRVVNTYGVAEAAVDSTYFEVGSLSEPVEHPARVSMIGRPLPGVSLAVVDPATNTAVSAGRPGEIRIGGPAVGWGYLGDPVLTASRFPMMLFGTGVGAAIVTGDPVAVTGDPAAYAPQAFAGYRTGDIGVLREDGIVEYIGRSDVVARPAGVLELARIEGLIRELPQIGECLVADVGRPEGGKMRVAYVVMADESEEPLDTEAVRAAVNGMPPGTRLLDTVVTLPALPRTRAGKIDRAWLPSPVPRSGFIGGGGGGGSGGGGRSGSLKGGTSVAATGQDGCVLMLVAVSIVVIVLVLIFAVIGA